MRSSYADGIGVVKVRARYVLVGAIDGATKRAGGSCAKTGI